VNEVCWLLDGSVLINLALDQHVHSEQSHRWFSQNVRKFSTCSVTQGTLLRLHMQFCVDRSAGRAWNALQKLVDHPFHEFWEEGFSYLEINPRLIQGHRQITDTWLVSLARKRKGKLATLDLSLAAMYPEDVELVAG